MSDNNDIDTTNPELLQLNEDVVSDYKDEKADISSHTETDTTTLVAKAKVHIDESKYKYSETTKDEYNQLPVPLSVYSAISREKLNAIIDGFAKTIEYNNDVLRNQPVDANSRNELITQNKNLSSILETYLLIRESLSPNTSGIDGLLDENADIKHGISFGTENRLIAGMPPKVDLSRATKPDIFLTVLNTALGSATEIRIPLPASGFAITLNAPPMPEIIGMMSRISRIERMTARSVIGYTFSAQSADTINEIINLFLAPAYIKRCTLDVPFEDIQQHIKRADIDVLLGHFSWLMYPTGYNYIIDCLNYIQVKTGIEEETREEPCGCTEKAEVDILNMIWYDNNKLTDKQRIELASSKHTVESIANYQKVSNEGYLKEYSTITLIPKNKGYDPTKQIDKIVIYLKSPNLTESIDIENRWLSKLDKYIDDAGGTKIGKEGLEALAESISISMIVSMYTSYIDRIEMIYFDSSCGEEKIITNTDTDSISNILESVSSNPEYGDIIAIKINQYIEKVRIGFMGIPNKRCPKCNLPQPNEIEGIKLIPINPLKDFFTACRIRMI